MHVKGRTAGPPGLEEHRPVNIVISGDSLSHGADGASAEYREYVHKTAENQNGGRMVQQQ